MNIKTVLNPISTHLNVGKVSNEKKVDTAERIHKDREGDGQQHGSSQEERRRLTEEELSKALKNLKNIPGVKEHHLLVEVKEPEDGRGFRTVLLKDSYGKIIRRYVEHDLFFLLKREAQEKGTGQLLNKAM